MVYSSKFIDIIMIIDLPDTIYGVYYLDNHNRFEYPTKLVDIRKLLIIKEI